MVELTKTSAVDLWQQESLIRSFDEERKGEFEKTENGEKVYFLKLQYGLAWKLVRPFREQQSCLW